MTERLHFCFSPSCIGEGNGNPPQCSCLENPRDGGAWWAAVYGVAQSRTRLKRLSSNSSLAAGTADIKPTSACLGRAISNVASCSLGEERPTHSSLAQTGWMWFPSLRSLAVESRAKRMAEVEPGHDWSISSSDLAWPTTKQMTSWWETKGERAGSEEQGDEIRFTMRHQNETQVKSRQKLERNYRFKTQDWGS